MSTLPTQDETKTSASDADLATATKPLPGTKALPGKSSVDRIEQTLAEAEAALDEARRHGDLPNLDASNLGKAIQDDSTRTQLKVSILMPVFNECKTLVEIVDRVREQAMHTELLIVDDCSTDGTRDLLIDLDQQHEDITVIMHGYNKGKGAALKTALSHARGDIVLIQDADLEYNPTDYAKLIEPIQRGEADVVYGSRFLEGRFENSSFIHRLGNQTLTTLSNMTTGLRLTDMETCYKAIRRGAMRGIVLRENRFGFEPEVTAKLARQKARFTEVPISYDARDWDEGKKIGLKDGLRAIWCILRYAWIA